MGFESPRGRGGLRGGNRSGKREKSGDFKSPGGSAGNLKGGDQGRNFAVNKRGESTPNSNRGRGTPNIRGGRGGSDFRKDRGGSNLRGGRGSFTPRGNRGSSEFRGSMRGARGSFSEKSRANQRDKGDSNFGVHGNKGAFSASTPVHNKKGQKRRFGNKAKNEDSGDNENALSFAKKKKIEKTDEANAEEMGSEDESEMDMDEEIEVEDEDGDEGDVDSVASKRLDVSNQKNIGVMKKNVKQKQKSLTGEVGDVLASKTKAKHLSKEAVLTKNSVKSSKVDLPVSDNEDEESEEDDEDDEEDEEESEEDEEQNEPIVETPAVKQIKDVKSVLKSGKGMNTKKSVNVSEVTTPATSSKKLPVTPYPQKKVSTSKETPKAKLNFDDDSSDEEEEEIDEATDEDDEEEDEDNEDEEDDLQDSDEDEVEEESAKQSSIKDSSKKKKVSSGKQLGHHPQNSAVPDLRTSTVSVGRHDQSVKKKTGNSAFTEGNEDRSQDVSKKADFNVALKSESRGQNVKKKSLNSTDVKTDNRHSSQDKRSVVVEESGKKRAIQEMKKGSGEFECAAVLGKENSSPDVKKKAVDNRATGNKDQFGKGNKKKAINAGHTAVVNKGVSDQIVAKKPTADKDAVVPSNESQTHAVKRKLTDDDRKAKHIKLDESSIINEENRRRQERDERSLFIKGFPKNTKTKELEELYHDFETVRHRKGSPFAWIVFRNEAACNKAHGVLSKAKVGGRDLIVDFCGSKSTRKPNNAKESLPVNPLELYINGLSAKVTKEDLKNVFRAAVSIHIPNARFNELRRAFVLFSSEDDAKAAFDKGRGLKLGGQSVEVFYARVRKNVMATVKPNKESSVGKKSSVNGETESVVAKPNGKNDSDDEIPSSNEGIEEVVKRPTKKGAVGKDKLTKPLKNMDEDKEDEEDEDDNDHDDDDDNDDDDGDEDDNDGGDEDDDNDDGDGDDDDDDDDDDDGDDDDDDDEEEDENEKENGKNE